MATSPQTVLDCSSKAYFAVHKTEGRAGNVMYVLLDNRAAFDLIDLPEGGNARVRHKAIDAANQYIIFQFWIKDFQKLDDAFGLMAYQFKNLAARRMLAAKHPSVDFDAPPENCA